jgi:tetratricopeptide (TPR) repeat protein
MFTLHSSSQTQVPLSKVKETYQDGEDFFESEDYKEAIFYFLQIVQKGYITANLQFKIGTCYLNIPGQETKAIPYLEEAMKHISTKYKTKSLEEKMAPLHALFYLGNAYRIDNQLDKALKIYDRFYNNPGFDGNYNPDLVENEIEACKRAKLIQDAPVSVNFENLGEPINTPSSDTHPVISADETMLVYLTNLKLYNAVYVARKVDNTWLTPENINPQILSDGDFYPTAISSDGKELYLVKKDSLNSDIYVSNYSDGKWTPAKKLNKNINSSKQETYASITSDGKTLYFSSNRRESHGGFDIFRSSRDANGDWGSAENLGKVINSKEDEVSPSISPDGKTLYFSSKGGYNMGGFDIFCSTFKDNKWTEPVNVGYPVNTTNDNVGYQVVNDKTGYMSRIAKDGYGEEDIYKIVFAKAPDKK